MFQWSPCVALWVLLCGGLTTVGDLGGVSGPLVQVTIRLCLVQRLPVSSGWGQWTCHPCGPRTPSLVLTRWWVDPVSGVDGCGLGVMDLMGGWWVELVPDMVECQVWVGPTGGQDWDQASLLGWVLVCQPSGLQLSWDWWEAFALNVRKSLR